VKPSAALFGDNKWLGTDNWQDAYCQPWTIGMMCFTARDRSTGPGSTDFQPVWTGLRLAR
jgi:hypothetical protein